MNKGFTLDCVFGEFDRVGQKKIFEMKSGGLALAELKENDNICWSADDTGQRKQRWNIIEYFKYYRDLLNGRWVFEGKRGAVYIDDFELMTSRHFISLKPKTVPEILLRKYLQKAPHE